MYINLVCLLTNQVNETEPTVQHATCTEGVAHRVDFHAVYRSSTLEIGHRASIGCRRGEVEKQNSKRSPSDLLSIRVDAKHDT